MEKSNPIQFSPLRITKTELDKLDFLHRCVAEALIKTGEVIITERVTGEH
jgi:hypothetical protein